MFKPITLKGSNVSAKTDAFINEALFGVSGVFRFGNNLEYEIVSNNEIKIKDGLLISQGRFAQIEPATTESVRIANGHAGTTRYDLIVAHFETDGMSETFDIRLKQGADNGPVPSVVQGNTFTGAMINELPLYLVKLNGINIESITPQFRVYDSVFNMANKITVSPGKPSGGSDGDLWFVVEG